MNIIQFIEQLFCKHSYIMYGNMWCSCPGHLICTKCNKIR